MKPLSTLFFLPAMLLLATILPHSSAAQQYKLRQSTGMMGMKSETTIYVKKMRKRTESAGYMGQASITTIEQCDLQRTIRINDKKKMYYIEPFSKDQEEVIDEDAKPAAVKAKPPVEPGGVKKGGIITMWYTITDTGERKKMYGFTARHVWTTQKIKPSADACTMKDSMIIKTDGWYIDLPEFNCPVRYTPSSNYNGGYQKPDCIDKYVARRSGRGKLGFALTETRTIIMGNGQAQTNEFKTDLETIELTTGKLDSLLFEIPAGYTQVMTENELQDVFDAKAMVQQYKDKYQHDNTGTNVNASKAIDPEQKSAGVIRIGVYEPKGDAQASAGLLQQYLVGSLQSGKVEAVAVSSPEDAKRLKCDYELSTDFTRMKQASKVGGLIKAIKNTDPSAATSYNVEASMLLVKIADGSTVLQPRLDGKYEGRPEDAARKALDEGSRQVLKSLK